MLFLVNTDPLPATLVVNYQSTLLAATSNGVYRFRLAPGTRASFNWRLVVALAVVNFGSAGAVAGGF